LQPEYAGLLEKVKPGLRTEGIIPSRESELSLKRTPNRATVMCLEMSDKECSYFLPVLTGTKIIFKPL
jgi:hypothetical protein